MLILGLSYDIDASAALVQDGEVIAASAEERFTRVKHDRSFPQQALQYCLEHGGVSLEELDWVVLGWNPTIHLQPLLWRMSSRIRHHAEYLSAVPNMLLQGYPSRPRGLVTEQVHHFSGGEQPLRVGYVEHHLCHAAWSFVSPFERCAVLTVDGFGEQSSTLLGRSEGTEIEVYHQVMRPHSLGSLYAALTQYLGFSPNRDEGTVMSLAAMGEPRYLDKFRDLVRVDEERGTFEMDLSYFSHYQESVSRVSEKFVEAFGPARGSSDEIEDRHCELASSLQAVFEEAYLSLLRHLQGRSGEKDLVVCGGVALNCVANGRILAETDFERVFIPPASGDDGAAAGGALYFYHSHLGHKRRGHVFRRAFLGPEYSDPEVQRELDLARREYRTLAPDQSPLVAARLIAAGQVVGWFQGRSEFGPRALGNRTILADPRTTASKDALNAKVKFRLPFRPFAPSMLAERCADLFEGGGESPFMLFAYRVKPDWADRVAGILHTDGTARVQTVRVEENARYHALITEFDRLTGVPLVLNTSLNVRGAPIANTPHEALSCFDTTAMDFLFIGNHLLMKGGEEQASALEGALREKGEES